MVISEKMFHNELSFHTIACWTAVENNILVSKE